MLNWLFRNRQTGRITIAQFPNVSLGIYIVARIAQWLLALADRTSAPLDVVAVLALLWWAVDEVFRGVNPWRRILGGTVLVFTIVGLVVT